MVADSPPSPRHTVAAGARLQLGAAVCACVLAPLRAAERRRQAGGQGEGPCRATRPRRHPLLPREDLPHVQLRPVSPGPCGPRALFPSPLTLPLLPPPPPLLNTRPVRQTLHDIEAGLLKVEQLPTITVVNIGQGCQADGHREVVSLNNRCLRTRDMQPLC
jgi:hypothetical protein